METLFEHPAEHPAAQENLMPIPTPSPQPQKDRNLKVNDRKCDWVFTLPPDHLKHQKILLLTIGGVGVHAVWTGPLGLYYSAYDASATL